MTTIGSDEQKSEMDSDNNKNQGVVDGAKATCTDAYRDEKGRRTHDRTDGFVPIQNWQDKIFAQLAEMFGDATTSEIICSVCTDCDWNVDACIEKLIGMIEAREPSPVEVTVIENKSHKIHADNEIEISKKFLGAIPKSTNILNTITQEKDVDNEQTKINFASVLSQGKFQDLTNASSQLKNPRSQLLDRIIGQIDEGYKVMVIMRGAPGSGKSYLAREIVDKTVRDDYRNHIFSTDNYFYNIHDQYVYRPDHITEAHEFNKKLVRQKAMAGWSPIIVDNTNMRVWEMAPYVSTAVRYGYLIELLEPDTPWCYSAGKMAAKNTHGVPKNRIERMLMNYEPITVEELLKINNETYAMNLPQLRHNPPLSLSSNIIKLENLRLNEETECKNDIENWQNAASGGTDDTCTDKWGPPKPPRLFVQNQRLLDIKNFNECSSEQQKICDADRDLGEDATDWKSYEEESREFWQQKKKDVGPKPQRKIARCLNQEEKIIEILKSNEDDEKLTGTSNDETNVYDKMTDEAKLLRHRIDCRNENHLFALVRQIYPHKSVDGLWDLFETCNGNADWTIDVLLKDDSCVEHQPVEVEMFQCNCDENSESAWINEEKYAEMRAIISASQKDNDINKESRNQRMRKERLTVEKMEEAKQTVLKQFVLSDEHYSPHLRKIRDIRHGVENNQSAETSSISEQIELMPDDTITKELNQDIDESFSEEEHDEMMEISLGEELISQLETTFGDDTTPKYNLKNFKTNVFMPRTIAKQLYALWMESLRNQLEENRLNNLKEDEEFARILSTYNKEEHKNSKMPKSLQEIRDMELAWKIYKSDTEWKESEPTNLASHLTRLELAAKFPEVDKKTLLEILAAHDDKYTDTVAVLKNSINCDPENQLQSSINDLMQIVKNEPPEKNSDIKCSKTEADSMVYPSNQTKVSPECAKKEALKDFEEYRNLASHHTQLKAECYQKAKDAIQKGSTAVAVYYSQIASLHKSKIDTYNQKAANCIMEVHGLTQNNPDFIDLHYLHVLEAVQCLDIFLDKHIAKMQNISRYYKNVFIITGRGLHSARGVPAIKNKVKSRLVERNLKWSEVNSGLLRVRIYFTSKYSKNIPTKY